MGDQKKKAVLAQMIRLRKGLERAIQDVEAGKIIGALEIVNELSEMVGSVFDDLFSLAPSGELMAYPKRKRQGRR